MPLRNAIDTARVLHTYSSNHCPRKENTMNSHFTLGVEEEFQMVDRNTGQLVSVMHTILDKGSLIFGDYIIAETPQCSVELNTNVCSNVTAVRLDLQEKTVMLARLLEEDGLTFIRSGTHPSSHWRDQRYT